MSAYYGVRFYAKGTGNITVAVPIDATMAEYNHFQKSLNISEAGWKLFEIPFDGLSQPWGTPQTWDASTIIGVEFDTSGPVLTTSDIYVDDIEFYLENEAQDGEENVFISYRPKVNQVGYYPWAKKYFTVVTQTASVSDTFYVKYKSNSATAYTGTIQGGVISDPAAGEDVVKGDFSSLTAEGEYFLEVNGQVSYNFRVGDNAAGDVFSDALRAFYIIRANDPLSDPVTGLSHPAAHQSDAAYDDKPGSRDMKGGWYNAGDYGKWTHEAAISVSFMMWLYEIRTSAMQSLDTDIPESGNGVPDILDEARLGLDWLFKMQNADGSVYHKVDTEPDFPWGLPPESDPYTRTAKPQAKGSTQFSTIDADDFCAVMLQGYRVFSSMDPAFAAKCSTAAKAAWDWKEANPKIANTDPYYSDTEYWQEEMWAQAEMFRLTGDTAYSSLFEGNVDAHSFGPPWWGDPQFFGYIALYYDPLTPAGLKTKIENDIISAADSYKALCDASGYNVAAGPSDYWWGCASVFAAKGNVMLFAYIITGDESYRDYALFQFDFFSGVNALEQMFYTGYGTKKNENPYHWTRMVYNNPLPGWLTGGPNPLPTGADQPLVDLQNLGTPAQKCWLDLCASNGSWASNEGTTDQNAQLVFLTGFFYEPEETPSPTPVITPAATPGNKASLNLNNAYAYPSPFRPGSGTETITFTNLTGETNIRVFNLEGRLVLNEKTGPDTGEYGWKVAGVRKENLPASGIYIYVLSNAGGEVKKGKIAIIR